MTKTSIIIPPTVNAAPATSSIFRMTLAVQKDVITANLKTFASSFSAHLNLNNLITYCYTASVKN